MLHLPHPLAVSGDATIVAVGRDQIANAAAQGSFTCVPDDPSTPGNDPMCMDRNAFERFKALLAHENSPEGKVWLAYMLKVTVSSQASRKEAGNRCKRDRMS
jgi:hypothetical protein